MDLMYLSTLDLPGSLISESRTSASSSSQVSMALSTCTHPIHSQPAYVRTLYTDNPRTCTHPIHNQPAYVCTLFTDNPVHVLTLYTDNPRMPQKIGFFVFTVILRISPSTLHATSDVRHFRCIHKYLQ
jgi:hypothetical protein